MAAVVIKSFATYIGPAASRAGQLAGASPGDYYREDDTGDMYQLSGDGLTWILTQKGGSAGGASGDKTPTHTAPTATTVTGALLAANASRKAALLQNIGNVDVFINLGAAAVLNTGIRLDADGGTHFMSGQLDNLDVAAINGITASGSAIVLVTEYV